MIVPSISDKGMQPPSSRGSQCHLGLKPAEGRSCRWFVTVPRRVVPFALTGGCGIFARGSPLPYHDVGVLVRHEHVDAALGALTDVGVNTSDPAENRLAKAYDDGGLVNLIHRPNEEPVTLGRGSGPGSDRSRLRCCRRPTCSWKSC